MTPTLRVGDTVARCHVLGPGVRAVIWVTGCHLRCLECIAPEYLDFGAGGDRPITELAEWILGLDAIDGVTFSGGEPFEQAGALASLVDQVRAVNASLNWMAFTGYKVEHLRRDGSAGQQALLERLDLVVDGPYVPRRHGDARWRGSSNQRLHELTGRVALDEPGDSAGVEVTIDPDGSFRIVGVPPSRGFRADFEARLEQLGVSATTDREGR
jgi:anaerobic ribonucleoside-triphosphate reductase activating protein